MNVVTRLIRSMTRITATTGLVLIASCSPAIVDTYCLNYQLISYSASQDTAETVRQVKEANAVWSKLCK
jgi:hypothetical protein